ncbi:NAD+ synthase [Thioalkalivibrio sp. ALE23]|uniref:NAD+ synthase n=1 Tax=Thioalkalivibrio sp. ALE23 TaxID=1265495 RepID=UPI00047772DD|nr:NAD+ synthase [Thioalkalivibrio sp. ALE23]
MTAQAPRIALAQFNPVVGALESNERRMREFVQQARAAGAHLVVFPELALTGYPPEDLLLRPAFLDAVDAALERLADVSIGIDLLVGAPRRTEEGLANAAVWLRNGAIHASYAKHILPNYSVFDEVRYFHAGHEPCVVQLGGWRLGVTVCEDIWQPAPAAHARIAGADVLLNLNASPFHRGKPAERSAVVAARVAETGCPVLYVNQVGGQDELVFDGRSFLHPGPGGTPQALLDPWEEGLALVELEAGDAGRPRPVVVAPEAASPLPPAPAAVSEADSSAHAADAEVADLYAALVTGIRDYVDKNGFPGVILGLSGGIDSGLTAALATDALGPERVTAVMMPYRYTASMSVEDARAQAETLGLDYHEVAIEPMVQAFLGGLDSALASVPPAPGDVTEENLQSRSRGVVLMGLSNRTGRMLLATGNKSELAVGYATLYGDMNGGFAPLKDVSKQWVWRLARWRNTCGEVIPPRVIERPPSAELAPGQADSDSLPPYPVLDAILEAFVEEEASVADIVARGFERETVERVARMVLRAEYKRRQGAPGVRVSPRAFGRDRRYPVTSGYRPE